MPTAHLVRIVTLLFALALLTDASSAQTQSIPLDPANFTLSERNFKIPQEQPPQHNGELLDFQGRRAFHHAFGLASAHNVEFENGAIDLDMAAADDSRFLGIAFRIQSDDAYECIFFRPRSSGTDQAVQYTPGMNGANVWQIYTGPGYTAVAQIPRNQWIHVRMVISGVVAKLYLDNASEPTIVIPDLKLGHTKGSVGFWGHMGGGYFSNLTITPDNNSYPDSTPQHFAANTLTDWQLSEILDATKTPPDRYPNTARLHWQKVASENPGMVVINRYRRSPNVDTLENADRLRGLYTGAQLVFARTTIHSDRARTRKLTLGYSDDVTVFLNGHPLYSGNNELGFRQPNHLGLIFPPADEIYLPLRAGDNELVLSVTEFFGGWGFFAKLED